MGKKLTALQEKQTALELKLKGLTRSSEKADAALHSIRKTISATDESTMAAGLEAKAAALQAWSETHQVTLEMTGAMLQLLQDQKNIWQTRYRLLNENPDPAELETIRLGIQSQLQEWFKRISLEQQHINAIRSRITALERQIDDENQPQAVKSHSENRSGCVAAACRRAV